MKYKMILTFDGGVEKVIEGEYPERRDSFDIVHQVALATEEVARSAQGETPRTDALMPGEPLDKLPTLWAEHIDRLYSHARQLERELAEAHDRVKLTANQRDAALLASSATVTSKNDTFRLDWLERQATRGLRWICRQNDMHQVAMTVRQAIDAAIRALKTCPQCGGYRTTNCGAQDCKQPIGATTDGGAKSD